MLAVIAAGLLHAPTKVRVLTSRPGTKWRHLHVFRFAIGRRRMGRAGADGLCTLRTCRWRLRNPSLLVPPLMGFAAATHVVRGNVVPRLLYPSYSVTAARTRRWSCGRAPPSPWW